MKYANIRNIRKYEVIVRGERKIVEAYGYKAGFRSIKFFAANGKVMHWLKKKEVTSVIYIPNRPSGDSEDVSVKEMYAEAMLRVEGKKEGQGKNIETKSMVFSKPVTA